VRNLLLFAALYLLCSCASLPREERAPHTVEQVLNQSASIGVLLDQEEQDSRGSHARQPAAVGRPPFQQPLKNIRVSSRFGKRHRVRHEGVDLFASKGTPVYASAYGQVVYAGESIDGYGLAVIVRHRRDYASLYAHASELRVQVGERVEKGQCLAYSGESGNATGPHLHFEIRKAGKPVDPLPFVLQPGKKSPR
jgi:murein DD-endopeptidase MepM/ murein hydrolase activator NlpD